MTEQKVIGVIPARYGSTRFKGKVLAPLAGKPLIQWVYEQAVKSKTLDDLIIAVDDRKVEECVRGFGAKAVMTGTHHQSGTDRIAEAVRDINVDIVVNIQGDQPLLDPKMIDEAVEPMINNPEIPMSTIKTEIGEEDFDDPGVVKVVVDNEGFALYFSRSLIPFPRYREGFHVYEHVGLYVYRKEFLMNYSTMPPGVLEQIESLEQLRALENGYPILVVETNSPQAAGVSVDTPEDLKKVELLIGRDA